MWQALRSSPGEALGLAATYALAFLFRLPIWDSHFWIDEAAVYYTAMTAGAPVPNVYYDEHLSPGGANTRWLFWQRPLHSLILMPAAAVSPEAFRFWFLVMSSFLPPLAVFFLRRRNVRPLLAYPVGVALSSLPFYVIFGVYAFPDTLMIEAFLLGWIALDQGNWRGGAIFFVAAAWLKEFALIPVLVLLVYRLGLAWRAAKDRRTRLAGPADLLLGAALLVGALPILVALLMGGPLPGWYRGGTYAEVLSRSFMAVVFAPVILVGLSIPRARDVCFLVLGLLGFFLIYEASGRGSPLYYFLSSGLFTLAAAALVLDELWTRAGNRTRRKAAVSGLAAFLALVPLLVVALPMEHPIKAAQSKAFAQSLDFSLLETYRFVEDQGDDYWAGLEFLEGQPWQTVFLVDAPWHDHFFPLPQRMSEVRIGATQQVQTHPGYLARMANVMENMTDVTFMLKTGSDANEVVRSVYGDCIRFENPRLAIIEAGDCSGRAQRLEAEYEARTRAL